MKRILTGASLLSLLVLSLTSCKVNWFDRQIDAEWWQIAIPIAILTVVLIYVSKVVFTGAVYKCTRCGKTFSPKWWRSACSIHINRDRLFKCPHCGRRSFCKYSYRKRDNDNENQE